MKNHTQQPIFSSTIIIKMIVMLLHCFKCSSTHCTVLGLPEDVMVQKGDVYFLLYNVPSVKLTLQCRCSLFTPQWMEYGVSSQTFHTSTDPVHCVKNGEDCSPISYISASNASPGFYLYQNATVESNQSLVLTCSSTDEKQTIVVSLRDNDPATNFDATSNGPLYTTNYLSVHPSPYVSSSLLLAEVQPTTTSIDISPSIYSSQLITAGVLSALPLSSMHVSSIIYNPAKSSKQTSLSSSSIPTIEQSITTASNFVETRNTPGSDSGGFQHAIKELGTLALALLAGTFVLIITNILSCACLLYMRRRQIKYIPTASASVSATENILIQNEGVNEHFYASSNYINHP